MNTKQYVAEDVIKYLSMQPPYLPILVDGIENFEIEEVKNDAGNVIAINLKNGIGY